MPIKSTQQVPRLKRMSEPADDTLISDAILQQVVKQVLWRVRVNRSYDVPYLGGSSRQGTVYIHRKLPRTFKTGGRRISADPFIILHEAIERIVGDAFRLSYQHAHQIALRVEQAAVRAAGIPWDDYNQFTREQEELAQENFSRLPRDLDLKPYRDENDNETLRRIRALKRAR